jgi:hypothetical protein
VASVPGFVTVARVRLPAMEDVQLALDLPLGPAARVRRRSRGGGRAGEPLACRRCGALLSAGVNIPRGRLGHGDYICRDCHNDVRRVPARDRMRRGRGWVDGRPPPKPPYVAAGERFGRWTALEDARVAAVRIRFRCDCGTVRELVPQGVIGLPRVFRTPELVLFHAASCRFRHSLRASCGVRYPSAE